MITKSTKRLALCKDDGGYLSSLEVGRLYTITSNYEEEKAFFGFLMIIDSEGEEFFYPRDLFIVIIDSNKEIDI